MRSTVEAPQQGLTVHVGEDGIATVLIDQPGSRVSIMNLQFIQELERAVDELERNRAIAGVIFASVKEGQFVAGADLEQVLEARTPEEASEAVRRLQRTFN